MRGTTRSKLISDLVDGIQTAPTFEENSFSDDSGEMSAEMKMAMELSKKEAANDAIRHKIKYGNQS